MLTATKGNRHLRLSVVVPTFNCQNTIEECLVAIRGSAYQNYELIVTDDGSTDRTVAIARKYADKLLILPRAGRTSARENGLKVAEGCIRVNIDSDILVKNETLSQISDFFETHPRIIALTGCLSKNTPDRAFFSQYKNLYMHYIFSKLPEQVTFLYGSIYATRAASGVEPESAVKAADLGVKTADDTELGQRLAAAGKPIAFLKNLQVIHLKKFTCLSFLKNDFDIPFDWALIFLRYQGWRKIGKHGTGFCHAPKEQLLSVVLAPSLLVLLIMMVCGAAPRYLLLGLAALWFLLNMRFLVFLVRERGGAFGVQAAAVTFFDHSVMAAGILCGSFAFLIDGFLKKKAS